MKPSHLLLALLLAPAASNAQQPTTDFAAFQKSLDRVKTSIALEMLDRDRRKDSLAAAPLVERGLIALRRFEITANRQDANRARQLFGKATDRYPALPWAHYGLGLALARGPDVRIKSPLGVLNRIVVGQTAAQLVGLDPRSRAQRSLKKALELDPLFTAAALEVAELALQDQDKGDLEFARNALAHIVAHGASAAQVSTALSNVEASLGNMDAAGSAADAAIADAPTDASALHARATALLRKAQDPAAGARAYFAALDQLTPDAADEFFHDVIALAADSERTAWEGRDLAARQAWLRRFWDLRAARAGVTVGHRLAEHYRRLAFAQQKYRRKSVRGADPANALLHVPAADKLEYDDRGLIYIRHGKPDEVVASHSINLRPNESWVYRPPAGKAQLLHFITIASAPDYRLMDDILQAVDMTTTGFNTTSVIQLLEDRVAFEPRYALMIARLRESRAQLTAGMMSDRTGTTGVPESLTDLGVQAATLSAEERLEALKMVRTDSDRPRFDDPLPFFYDVYTFRGADGRTDITAAIAIPGQTLKPDRDPGLSYDLKLSLIVLDSTTGRVERTDTVVRYAAKTALVAGQHLRTQLGLSATPALATAYRVVASNAAGSISQGQMYGAPLRIPDYTGEALMLSDIVLAEPEPGGSWKRGNLNLRLVPPRQFARNRPLTLFYEVYNLPAGATYRTEVAILPADGGGAVAKLRKALGGKRGMRFSFEGNADNSVNGTIQEVRRLAPDLPAGRYRIQVKVTRLATGAFAQKDREFVVMK